jgi:hypothetical protein
VSVCGSGLQDPRPSAATSNTMRRIVPSIGDAPEPLHSNLNLHQYQIACSDNRHAG